VVVEGTRAYLLRGWDGVDIIDVSSPVSPSHLGSLFLESTFIDKITVEGDLACLTIDSGFGVSIYDVSDPESVALIGQLTDEIGYVRDLQLEGDLLYVAGNEGLSVVDVSDPGKPEILFSGGPSYADDVLVAGGKAYLDVGELQIYHRSRPRCHRHSPNNRY
jgi:hypothetical protein